MSGGRLIQHPFGKYVRGIFVAVLNLPTPLTFRKITKESLDDYSAHHTKLQYCKAINS